MLGRRFDWIEQPRTWLALAVTGLYLILAIPSTWKTGVTTDEVFYMKAAKIYGYYAFEAVASLNPFDPDLLYIWSYNREHPPLAKVAASIPWGLALVLRGGDMPVNVSVFAHRLGPIALSAASVFLLTRWISGTHGRWGGAAAGLSLVLMPRWFAHSRYAALDGPMAVMWLFTAWACWKGLNDRRWAVIAGVVFGLALATKLNAFFIPVAMLAWLLLAHRDLLWEKIGELREGRVADVADSPLGRMVLSGLVLGPLVFFVTWPWLWTDTIPHLAGYFEKHLTHTHFRVNYLGQTYRTAPWHFPFVTTALTVPLTILALTVTGIVAGVRDEEDEARNLSWLMIANAAIPILLLTLPTPKYGGIRLFLPAFPFLAGLSGIGFAALLDEVRTHIDLDDWRSWAVPLAALALLALPGAHAYATMDPYEEVYYNSAIGGPEGAWEAGFELETWGQSDIEVVPWLNARANASEPIQFYMPAGANPFQYYEHGDIGYVSQDLKAAYSMPGWIAEQQPPLEENVTRTHNRSEADVVLLMSYPAQWSQADHRLHDTQEPAFRFEVRGAPLLEAYDV